MSLPCITDWMANEALSRDRKIMDSVAPDLTPV
jgi:hypothetical protein